MSSFPVSAEDIEASKAIQSLQSQGKYMLRFEDPIAKKFNEFQRNRMTAAASEKIRQQYGPLVSSFAISPERHENILEHLSKIFSASLEAESAIAQLTLARNDYDKTLRETLSAEEYNQFREFEESKPAKRELELITEFLSARQMQLPASDIGVLTRFIRDERATTERFFHGPYNGLPEMAFGEENVSVALSRDADRIEKAAAAMLARAIEAGLSAETVAMLQTYYSSQAHDRRTGLARAKEGMKRFQPPPVPPPRVP